MTIDMIRILLDLASFIAFCYFMLRCLRAERHNTEMTRKYVQLLGGPKMMDSPRFKHLNEFVRNVKIMRLRLQAIDTQGIGRSDYSVSRDTLVQTMVFLERSSTYVEQLLTENLQLREQMRKNNAAE